MTRLPISHIQEAAEAALNVARPYLREGRVASYIPALSSVNPDHLGLAAVTLDGHTVTAGDAVTPFSIQSISKVFTLTLALNKVGEKLWARVGREPSGTAFNSIVQLESEAGRPRNPLINAGAIATTDQIINSGGASGGASGGVLGGAREAIDDIESFLQTVAMDTAVEIDLDVAASEAAAGSRNRSLAHFMAAFGNLTHPVETVLDVYFHQCALKMTCLQLARAGLYLANEGVDPLTGKRITSVDHCRQINAVMMQCGHYDNSGEFAVRVGLPGKSGVGGGILAIAPGKGAVAVWSPGLNEAGTSFSGAAALEHFSAALDWSVFSV